MATLNVKDTAMLREADETECLAGGFASGKDALHASIAQSTLAFEHKCGGEVVAWWGWRELTVLGGGCVAWMLSAPAIERHRHEAARDSLRLLRLLLEEYGDVFVLVDGEYALALRWLRWLGFREFRPQEGRFIQLRAVREGAMN